MALYKNNNNNTVIFFCYSLYRLVQTNKNQTCFFIQGRYTLTCSYNQSNTLLSEVLSEILQYVVYNSREAAFLFNNGMLLVFLGLEEES